VPSVDDRKETSLRACIAHRRGRPCRGIITGPVLYGRRPFVFPHSLGPLGIGPVGPGPTGYRGCRTGAYPLSGLSFRLPLGPVLSLRYLRNPTTPLRAGPFVALHRTGRMAMLPMLRGLLLPYKSTSLSRFWSRVRPEPVNYSSLRPFCALRGARLASRRRGAPVLVAPTPPRPGLGFLAS
jgi:hypothetical protein